MGNFGHRRGDIPSKSWLVQVPGSFFQNGWNEYNPLIYLGSLIVIPYTEKNQGELVTAGIVVVFCWFFLTWNLLTLTCSDKLATALPCLCRKTSKWPTLHIDRTNSGEDWGVGKKITIRSGAMKLHTGWAPTIVINGVVTPISRVKSPQLSIYMVVYRSYKPHL